MATITLALVDHRQKGDALGHCAGDYSKQWQIWWTIDGGGEDDNDGGGEPDDDGGRGDKETPQQSRMINSGGCPEGLPESSKIITAMVMYMMEMVVVIL